MKNVVIILSAALLAASCAGHKGGYLIEGEISGKAPVVSSGEAYLTGIGFMHTDTAKVENGVFRFKADRTIPGYHTITFSGIRGNIRFFLEDGEFKITAVDSTLWKAEVTGGETQDLDKMLEQKKNSVLSDNAYRLLLKLSKDGDDAAKEKAKATIKAAEDTLNAYSERLIAEHPSSFFAVNYMFMRVSDLPFDELEAMAAPFMEDSRYNGYLPAETVRQYVLNERNLAIGAKLPDLSMSDPDGKSVSFSEVYSKNKVTLLDFWAGWCAPCRKFNPVLKEIYADYHDKGFEVLGISLDKAKKEWTDAIGQDDLPWPQVSDLHFWQNAAAVKFNIRYIPQNLFVDGEGRVIARRLQGEEEIRSFLEKQLSF